MNITIEKGNAYGKISAPPSKSYGHRMLICAALAQGESVIEGISGSEDMLATIDCIKALGCTVSKGKGTGDYIIKGCSRSTDFPIYDCRESGSTLRFFVPIALACTGGGIFKGSARLIERGIGIYEEIFGSRGIIIKKSPDEIIIKGHLKSGYYKVRGDVSSQFISGLLFALPLLEEESIIEITGPSVSRSYIDITLAVLRSFGIDIKENPNNIFQIPGGQSYKPQRTRPEGDWSNAAFFIAISMLQDKIKHEIGKNGGLTVTGLLPDSIQGDRICVKYFEKLQKGCKDAIDISDCPDLGPILFAFAAACTGASFTGIDRLRIKESDRASAMKDILSEFGIESVINGNDMEILPGTLTRPKKPIYGYNDHRIVMSAAVLMTLTGGTIEGAEAVAKSYPSFFEDLGAVGIDIKKTP